MELLAEAINDAFCKPVGTWPLTYVNTTARVPCRQSDRIGFLERRCEEENGKVVWREVDRHRCESPTLADDNMQLVVKVTFAPQTGKGKIADVQDALESLAGRLNCDDVRQMTELYWESDGGETMVSTENRFVKVFKHCKVEEETMEVLFMSKTPVTVQWIQSFFQFAPITSIHVLQEGLVVRNAFELVFTKRELVDCNPQMYLYCNRRDIRPSYYCSYRFLPVTQHSVYSPQDGLWLF